MDLYDYLRVLRRRWWMVATLALLGIAAGLALTLVSPKEYSTTATLLVATPGGRTAADLQAGNQFAQDRAATYAAMATSTTVLGDAIQSLGLRVSPQELMRDVSATARADTALIDVTVRGNDPQQVARIANAIGQSLDVEVSDLESPGSGAQTVRVQSVQPALRPTIAVLPQPRNNALVGAGVGLALGIALVLLLEAADSHVRTPRDVVNSIGRLPAASIQEVRGRKRVTGASERRREAFRTLRAGLRHDRQGRAVIAVAGVGVGDDATDMVLELARAMAESGSTAVIVDTDLRHGATRLTRGRGKPQGEIPTGLADILERRASLPDALAGGPIPNLYVLPPGQPSSRSAQLLGTSQTESLVTELRNRFDCVILSCPPVLERSDSSIVASLADLTVVVVDARTIKRSELIFAVETLAGVGVDAPRIVLHNVRRTDMLPAGLPAEGAA